MLFDLDLSRTFGVRRRMSLDGRKPSPRMVSVSYLIPLRPLPAGDGAGSPCPKADLAGATERAAQAAREGNSPEGRPLTTRAAISATGITWAVDIASMTRVA